MRRAAIKGFTLLEVVVAMTILAIGLPVVFHSLSQSSRSIRRVSDAYTRVEYAKNLLADVDLIGPILPGDRAQGQFADGTNWSLEAAPFLQPAEVETAGPSLVKVTLTLAWNGRSGAQNWALTTYRFSRRNPNATLSMEARLSEIK